MRVHRLEIEALGPFADQVTIDVDALSADGLFLIHGPTGSGKTSLLDAICFALYADVPGARSKRGLRSDHAPPDAVPRVSLELTAGVRRLRITRSPEFARPKKRGTGVSKVQAQVSLEERVDDRWVPVSTRHDEVADVVKDALGMGMAQFAKVVLLPQGEFAAFLRSTPEDRREVLERLFDISAFSDVEAWLAEARRTAGADLEQARTELATTLSRVEDVLADVGSPAVPHVTDAAAAGDGPAPAGDDPAPAVKGSAPTLAEVPADRVAAHVDDIARALDARVTTTMAAFDAASGAERTAAESLAAGRSLADLRARGTRALARLSELTASGPAHLQRVATLAEAERAAALAGHLGAHDRAAADEAATRDRADGTRQALHPSPLVDASDDEVDELLRRARGLDTAAAALAHELELAAGRGRRRAELEVRAEQLGAATTALRGELGAAEAERDALTAQVRVLAAGAGRVPELELLLSAARHRVAVFDAAEQDLTHAHALAPRRSTLREATLDRRTELLDLRQRRLDGMAAELARALADGDPCPVCGGVEHPAPARVSDPVLPGDLAAAERRLDAADAELRVVDSEVESLTTRARTRLAALGDETTRQSLEAAVSDGADHLASARADAAEHAALSHQLESATAAVQAHHAEIAAAGARADSLATLLEELDVADAVGAARADELRALHGDCPCGATEQATRAEAFDHTWHSRVSGLLGHHAAAVADLRAARARARVACVELDAALATAGFVDLAAARAAMLPHDEVARLRAQVTSHVEDAAATRAVVEDLDVAAALLAAPPDLAGLQAADRAARSALLATAAAQDEAARAMRSIDRLLPLVRAAGTAVATAAAHDVRVRDLADTASGIGPDNTLRMRLTAYVLAARLEKVATLANERLAVLGGGRYLLEHSDERAARGARSGLGLRVLDQWTGRVRDTATLSGGESFMASLALALGLADAVREEAGGLDLGTLFIDEGFGSLDDDSLEQVLTVLDGLREGGRAVGVVSHVADLRARISHQAVVHKGETGSSVEVRTVGRADQPAA